MEERLAYATHSLDYSGRRWKRLSRRMNKSFEWAKGQDNLADTI
jgi:hypothetical protein